MLVTSALDGGASVTLISRVPAALTLGVLPGLVVAGTLGDVVPVTVGLVVEADGAFGLAAGAHPARSSVVSKLMLTRRYDILLICLPPFSK